jgi:multidrug efflux pump subunit AcrB
MTALATIFDMLSLGLGVGVGGTNAAALAIAVIGEVTEPMILFLVTTPVIFSMVRQSNLPGSALFRILPV